MANYFYDSFTVSSDTNIADHTPDTDPGSVGWTQILYTTRIKASIDAAIHESGTAGQVAACRRGSLPSNDGYVYINAKTGQAANTYRAYIGLTNSDRNGYFAMLRGDGYLLLYMTTGGVTTASLGSYSIPDFSASTTYKVGMRCVGTSIKAYLNDVERIDATDDDYSTRDNILLQIYNTTTASSVEVYDLGYERITTDLNLSATLDTIGVSASLTQAKTATLSATLDTIGVSASLNLVLPPELSLNATLDTIGLSASIILPNIANLSATLDSIGVSATVELASIFEKINWTGGEYDSDPDTLPSFQIMRLADNYFLDFDDMNFKASGWTTKSMELTEIISSPLPVFQYELETSTFNGYYYFIPYSPDTYNKPAAYQEAYSSGVRITGGLTFSELATLQSVSTKTTALDAKFTSLRWMK